MNWIKNSTFHTFVLCLTLLFSASVFSVYAEEVDFFIDEKGLLTIGAEGNPDTLELDTEKLNSLLEKQESPDPEDPEKLKKGLLGIEIEKDYTLKILPDTSVGLGNSYLSVKGTLIITSDSEEIIDGYKEEEEEDGETISLYLADGGTIQILAGDPRTLLDADITLKTGGGAIDIAANTTLETGTISGSTGDLTKRGEGTYEVGAVSMGGTFNIEQGNVHFLDSVTVGKLMSGNENTTITGLQDDPETDDVEGILTINKGGEIQGTLENIGYLMVGDGSTAAELALIGEEAHHNAIGTIGIRRNAELDMKTGSIQFAADPVQTNDSEKEDYGDLIVEGTLRLSNAAGISKGTTENPADFNVTIAGYTNSSSEEINGVIDIYKSTDSTVTEMNVDESDMNIQIIGLGKISVEEDLTFKSGTVKVGDQSEATYAHLFVDGGGTYEAKEIDLGTGYLFVDENTTLNVAGELNAGVLSAKKDTIINASGGAEFTQVSIAGKYDAGGSNLTISNGGQITGSITDVEKLTLGKGELLLQVNSDSSEVSILSAEPIPMISAKSLDIDDNTRIRMVMGSGSYSTIFQIDDEDSRGKLVESLQAVQTALYRPTWISNTESKSVDLDLEMLSVVQYADNIWHERGENINQIAQLVDYLGTTYNLNSGLQGLSEPELQCLLRNMATGELAGNALQMALRPPAQSVFRHLDTVVPLRSPFTRSNYRGQIREGFNVWFNPFGQSEKADSDGVTYDGYDLTRYGFHLGGDIELYNRAVLGALFSYTNPQLKSGLGKVSADDYTAGLYFRIPTAWAVVANLMIGFGNQDYTYENVYGNSTFRGGSFFTSAELTRPVSFQTFQLTPLIAFDYQSAEMDDFIVRDGSFSAIFVEPGDVSQTAFRVGLLGNWGRFRTRLQYTRQLSGDDHVVSRTATLVNIHATTPVRSLEWGKDWINVGVGGELLTTRHWRIFADYNFDLGKHTTSHMGSLNTVLRW